MSANFGLNFRSQSPHEPVLGTAQTWRRWVLGRGLVAIVQLERVPIHDLGQSSLVHKATGVCTSCSVASTTAKRYYTDCFSQPSTLYNVCRMFLSLHVTLSVYHWRSSTGFTYRIQYKLALLTFTVHDNHWPVHLRESIASASSDPARQRLRSASSLDFIVPRTRTKFGDRAFSVAGPTIWGQLVSRSPSDQRRLLSVLNATSRHLFNIAFHYLYHWLYLERCNA